MKTNTGQFKKGQSASPETQFKKGQHSGKPTEFVKGMKPWNYGLIGVQVSTRIGKKFPERSNEKHPNWKGDKVGYQAIHAWIKKSLVKSLVCSHCGETKRLDLANISGDYKRSFDDWFWLCRSCHKKYDLSFRKGQKKFIHKTERRII